MTVASAESEISVRQDVESPHGWDGGVIEIPDPPDAGELIQWGEMRVTLDDYPRVVRSPWLNIFDSEKFLTSTLQQVGGKGWVRSAALFLLRRFRDAVEFVQQEETRAQDV